ncbi:MAG: MMPL family transporter [Acidobacteriota bacterium]
MHWNSAVNAALAHLSRLIRRGHVWILVFWGIVAAVLIPQAANVGSRLKAGVRLEGSPAASVDADLARRFHSRFVHRIVLVISGAPDPELPEGRAALSEIVAAVRSVPGVAGTLSYLDSPEPLFRGRAGGFVVVGLDGSTASPETRMGPLREATARVRARLASGYPSLELLWTGEIPLNLDVRQASSEDARTAERRALPVALLLLLAAFGSIVAALLPVSVGVLSVFLTLGVAALVARTWHLSVFVQNIASMIGLGLGIDYALLLVSRFRESLARKHSPGLAVEDCLPRAGQTLFLSALPVAIGFAALLTMPGDFRSIGAAGMLVTFFTLLLALTLLPAILAALGNRVDAGRVMRRNASHHEEGSRRWRRWGHRVVQRPWLFLCLGGLPVLLLALESSRLRTGPIRGDWLPSNPESVRAVQRLEDMGRGNVVQTLRVLLDLPRDAPVGSPEGWIATRRLAQVLARDPRIARVHSPADDVGLGITRERLREMSRDGAISEDQRVVLFEVLPAMRSNDPLELRADAETLARSLQASDAAAATGLPGTKLRVGGLPAANAQFEDAISGRLHSVVLLVMAVTFVVLLVGFRSVLVAAKAVALNLLTVAAAFGALVLVFQDGHGAELFGLDGGTGRVFTIVPILAFCIVFGLSMDYEVFLVSRVAEARRSGLPEEEAIVEGLARTGSVITSAGSIMIAVFAAFAMGAFLPIQMLGFVLAVAVLLDATVVRMVIGPALLRLAGKWNWWPGENPGLRRRSKERS